MSALVEGSWDVLLGQEHQRKTTYQEHSLLKRGYRSGWGKRIQRSVAVRRYLHHHGSRTRIASRL
eukprot:4638083-Prorocentrum_lima.AAC.1